MRGKLIPLGQCEQPQAPEILKKQDFNIDKDLFKIRTVKTGISTTWAWLYAMSAPAKALWRIHANSNFFRCGYFVLRINPVS